MSFQLSRRTYLVTGAASGIGLSTSKILAENGANVLMVDINEEALCKAAVEIGEKAYPLKADLTDFTILKKVIVDAVNQVGKINGFVHCAGLPYISPVRTITYDRAKLLYDLNTYAAIELAKICSLRSVKADNNCAFVLVSSVYGLVGSAANSAYAATKGAIVALTKSLAIEFAGKGIRVNCIAPGFVKTNMLGDVSTSFDSDYVENLENLHPLGLGEVSAIAEPIAFLLSDAARWITGSVLSVEGGFTAQ